MKENTHLVVGKDYRAKAKAAAQAARKTLKVWVEDAIAEYARQQKQEGKK